MQIAEIEPRQARVYGVVLSINPNAHAVNSVPGLVFSISAPKRYVERDDRRRTNIVLKCTVKRQTRSWSCLERIEIDRPCLDRIRQPFGCKAT